MARTTSNVQQATRNGQREQKILEQPNGEKLSTAQKADLSRTRDLLRRMQAENEHRAAQLSAAGLTSFTARADWLMDHWSKDQKLAWRRRWERLGLTDPEPCRRLTDHAARLVVCDRCGIPRLVRVHRPSPLCVDCRFVLSKEEIALWAGKKQVA